MVTSSNAMCRMEVNRILDPAISVQLTWTSDVCVCVWEGAASVGAWLAWLRWRR
jgi:hypothetical protein